MLRHAALFASFAAVLAVRGDTPAARERIELVGSMRVGRAAHTATLLPSGQVLIAGGMLDGGGAVRSFEIFDPRRNAIAGGGDMSVARAGHTATPLPDGRVLVAGGYNGTYLDSIELFDPRSGRFVSAGRLHEPRSGHTATLLRDGTVLFTGGVGTGWTFLASAEVYDPRSGRSTAVAPLTNSREGHTATRLPDGRVLIAGGHRGRRQAIVIYRSAEIYDPRLHRFTAAGDMTLPRHKHDAAPLRDGRVLILGGADNRDFRGRYASTEIFDPATGRFTAGNPMNAPRFKFRDTTLVLGDGRVLVAGGARRPELFTPGGAFRAIPGDFGDDLSFAASTVLADGGALIAGGYDDAQHNSARIWRYTR
jgi:hypothetical protein